MTWDIKPNIPVYIQLIDFFKTAIVSGTYKPGDRLPSVRDLACEASVNPNTIQRALSELERDGLIVTHRTNGKFITEDISLINSLKETQAMNVIKELFDKMTKMGYTNKEIVIFTERYSELDNNNY